MNQKMLDYWEFLKESHVGLLSALFIPDIEPIYREAEQLINRCKEVRCDWLRTKEIFFNYQFEYKNGVDQFYDGICISSPDRYILKWLYALTNLNPTFIYANVIVGEILNEIPGYKFEIKQVDELKLFNLLKEEKEQQIPESGEGSRIIGKPDNHRLSGKEKQKINVFCNKMDLSIPIKHFRVLTEKKSTDGETFLTIDQFNSFIEKAFNGNQDISKQLFNRGEFKIYIQSIFYDFYKKYNNYFPTSQCLDVFIKLLTDNFEGWDFGNVKENFAKKPRKIPSDK